MSPASTGGPMGFQMPQIQPPQPQMQRPPSPDMPKGIMGPGQIGPQQGQGPAQQGGMFSGQMGGGMTTANQMGTVNQTQAVDQSRRIDELERQLMQLMSMYRMGMGDGIFDESYSQREKARNGDFSNFYRFSGAGPDPRTKTGGSSFGAPSGKPGMYSPGGKMDMENRERIKQKNSAKKASKTASSPRPRGFKSAPDARAANQQRAEANKNKKPSNRIDY